MGWRERRGGFVGYSHTDQQSKTTDSRSLLLTCSCAKRSLCSSTVFRSVRVCTSSASALKASANECASCRWAMPLFALISCPFLTLLEPVHGCQRCKEEEKEMKKRLRGRKRLLLTSSHELELWRGFDAIDRVAPSSERSLIGPISVAAGIIMLWNSVALLLCLT